MDARKLDESFFFKRLIRHLVGDEGIELYFNRREISFAALSQPIIGVVADIFAIVDVSEHLPIWGVLFFLTLFITGAAYMSLRPQNTGRRWVIGLMTVFLGALTCGGVFLAQKAFASHGSIIAEEVPSVHAFQEALRTKLSSIGREVHETHTTVSQIDTKTEILITQAAQQANVSAKLLQTFANMQKKQDEQAAETKKQIDGLAHTLAQIQETNALLRDAPADVAAAAQNAQKRLQEGDLDAAAAILQKEEARLEAAKAPTDRVQSRLLSQIARVDELRLSYDAAARAYDEAAQLIKKASPTEALFLQTDRARVLSKKGRQTDDSATLLQALELYKRCIAEANISNNTPAQIVALDGLSDVLTELALFDGNATFLKQAVDASKGSLEGLRPYAGTQVWAIAQQGLGNALLSLAQRTNEKDYYRQAIDAFREAVAASLSSEDKSLQTSILSGLGFALYAYGTTETNNENLELAVADLKKASGATSSADGPERGCGLQLNLGLARIELGSRKSDRAMLDDGLRNVESCLSDPVFKQMTPKDTVSVLLNAGRAMTSYGEATHDEMPLKKAIDLYERADSLSSKQKFATFQNAALFNKALTMYDLGEIFSDKIYFKEAELSLRRVLQGSSQTSDSLAVRAKVFLGLSLYGGEREEDRVEAISLLRDGSPKIKDLSPLWFLAVRSLGEMLLNDGLEKDSVPLLSEAAACFSQALESFPAGQNKAARALLLVNLAHSLRGIGETKNDIAQIRKSIPSFEDAIHAFDDAHDLQGSITARGMLADTYKEVGDASNDVTLLKQAIANYDWALKRFNDDQTSDNYKVMMKERAEAQKSIARISQVHTP